MEPSIGRIVHFRRGGKYFPAIITAVCGNGRLDLQVFYRSGVLPEHDIGEGGGESTWRWPVAVVRQ